MPPQLELLPTDKSRNGKLSTSASFHDTGSSQLHAGLVCEVEHLRERQGNLLFAITSTKEDRATLASYNSRQLEAIDTALEMRNRGLKAVAEAQAAFVSELANSILIRDRSTLQVDAAEHFQKESLRLHELVQHYGASYYDLIERTLEDAGQRPQLIRQQLESEAARCLQQWGQATARLIDDYNALLTEKV